VADSEGPDSDYDTVPDYRDNCIVFQNTKQTNFDGDEFGDACDNDSDGDAYLDHQYGIVCSGGSMSNCDDNCPFTWQADQADWNGNAVGDACEDYDGDHVWDDKANCKELPNQEQDFHDSDSLGDACDPDDDNDGVPDATDNCPITIQCNQDDKDIFVSGNWVGDGIGDACDLCPKTFSSDNSDSDHDGLGNPCDLDDDGDGVEEDGGHNGIEGDHPCTGGQTLNCDDNCPKIKNKDQLDYNKNGIGSWCEAGDHPPFGKALQDDSHSFTWIPGRATIIPLPGEGDNPDWGQKILGLGYSVSTELETNVDVYAQVVDSNGMVAAKSSRHAANMREITLTYEPEAFAYQGDIHYRLFGASATAQDQSTIAPSAIRYYLQLYPMESVSYTETYTFTVQVTGGVPVNLYLPVVKK
jgi:hypothetical protein